MTIPILLALIAILAVLVLRQMHDAHHFDERLRIEQLCAIAQKKYSGLPIIDALDWLYRDLYAELQQGRAERKDVTGLIEDRQLVARERARLISAETQRENGLKLTRTSQI